MITDIAFWGGNELCDGGMRISWSYRDLGFGQFDIVKDKDGQIRIDSEYMGGAFVRMVLSDLVEGVLID